MVLGLCAREHLFLPNTPLTHQTSRCEQDDLLNHMRKEICETDSNRTTLFTLAARQQSSV